MQLTTHLTESLPRHARQKLDRMAPRGQIVKKQARKSPKLSMMVKLTCLDASGPITIHHKRFPDQSMSPASLKQLALVARAREERALPIYHEAVH